MRIGFRWNLRLIRWKVKDDNGGGSRDAVGVDLFTDQKILFCGL